MEDVAHDVDGIVLPDQSRAKGGHQRPQRTHQERPRISLDELLQRLQALPMGRTSCWQGKQCALPAAA